MSSLILAAPTGVGGTQATSERVVLAAHDFSDAGPGTFAETGGGFITYPTGANGYNSSPRISRLSSPSGDQNGVIQLSREITSENWQNGNFLGFMYAVRFSATTISNLSVASGGDGPQIKLHLLRSDVYQLPNVNITPTWTVHGIGTNFYGGNNLIIQNDYGNTIYSPAIGFTVTADQWVVVQTVLWEDSQGKARTRNFYNGIVQGGERFNNYSTRIEYEGGYGGTNKVPNIVCNLRIGMTYFSHRANNFVVDIGKIAICRGNSPEAATMSIAQFNAQPNI